MKRLTGTEETVYGMPQVNGMKPTFGDQDLLASGVSGGDAAEEPALLHLDQQEQLADDLVRLVAELKRKLENYLGVTAFLAPDDSSRRDSAAAVAWMEETIEDLVATVVGVEGASTPSPAVPVSRLRAVPDSKIA